MVVIHLSQHIHCIRIECQVRIVDHPKGIKLMAECSFSKYKLGSISPIEAVYAIRPAYAILQ